MELWSEDGRETERGSTVEILNSRGASIMYVHVSTCRQVHTWLVVVMVVHSMQYPITCSGSTPHEDTLASESEVRIGGDSVSMSSSI